VYILSIYNYSQGTNQHFNADAPPRCAPVKWALYAKYRNPVKPITVTYSVGCIRTAINNYWWYRFGSQYLYILIPVTAFLIYRVSIGHIAWYVWAISIVAIYYTVQAIVAYFLYLINQLRWFKTLEKPEVELEVMDEYPRIRSDVDVSEIEWNSIYDIRMYRNSWVLVLAPYMLNIAILPIDRLTQEEKSILLSNVNSVLFRTGQVWKTRIRLACSYFAMFLILAPWAFKPELERYAIYLYFTGLVFVIIAAVLSFVIRCPKCGTDLDSKSARRGSIGRWPHWLFALQKCPFCGAAGIEFGECDIIEPRGGECK